MIFAKRSQIGNRGEAVPWKDARYRHGEGNTAAHVKSSMMGHSSTYSSAPASSSSALGRGFTFANSTARARARSGSPCVDTVRAACYVSPLKMPETQTNYRDTLNLPQTAFPMKANLPQREPEMLARWEQGKLYDKIQSAHAQSPLFLLHDGPPFANGD